MAQTQRNNIFDKLYKLPISRSGDRAPRIPLKIKVLVKIPGLFHPFEVESINISRTGILLAFPHAEAGKITLGQVLDLTIDLECAYFADKVETPAAVVRQVESKDTPAGHTWIAMVFK